MQRNNDIDSVAAHRADTYVRAGVATYASADDVRHLKDTNTKEVLCGAKVKGRERSPNEYGPEIRTCAACNAVYQDRFDERLGYEVKHYWDNPASGRPVPQMVTLRKKRIEYKSVPLPDEYLPTGTGMTLRSLGR